MSPAQTLLHMTAALLVIIALAHIFGRAAGRVGQPAVVGEMVAGIVAGPTVLGRLAPQAESYLFHPAIRPALYALSMIGLALYMFGVGTEHEHPRGTRREAILPFALAAGGFLIPLTIGGALAAAVVSSERPTSIEWVTFSIFLGGALSLTAFPMLARFLHERSMTHTAFGRAATSAAALDDVAAWCILALVASLIRSHSATGIIWTALPAIAIAIACALLLPRLFRRPLTQAVQAGELSDALLASLVIVVLGVGWLCDTIGIYSVFGGFIVGVALPRIPTLQPLLQTSLIRPVRATVLPIFFAYSGLNTDLGKVVNWHALTTTAVLIAVALAAKSVPQYLVLNKVFHWSHRHSMAMAGLMNARGLMILIYINAGLQMGVLTPNLYAALTLVAVITTGLAMPVYRHSMNATEEQLAREAEPAPIHLTNTPQPRPTEYAHAA